MSFFLYFTPHSTDGKVHVWDRYLTVRELGSGTASGLLECHERALQYLGIADWEQKMIGLGCDGCSANNGGEGAPRLTSAEASVGRSFLVLSSQA